ncbi:MAG: carboxypeptidase regulatory-like domain-containing protein, partial [Acidobacteriota bacterium]
MARNHFQFRSVMRLLVLSLLVLATWSEGYAQSTTATIRGTVTNESGAPLANAEVNAVSTTTGFTHTVKAGKDGSFVLGGLNPGSYTIVTAAEGFDPRSQDLTVAIGQNLSVDFRMTPQMVVRENITVVGNQAIETRTSEIATNVSPHQIENLPQNERNFLNFAALAPGVSLSKDPQRKTISSGAQPAEQTNVFIDGVSMKNDVLQGGAVGQDASRGNPFPQNAVQEFRVITQNYSAQYDKASSAIITAVTKSGGNQFVGNAFVFYQPKSWVSDTEKGFQFSTLTTNESYKRYQDGISFGGPIVRDKLNFFVSYEGDNEHATTPVSLGNSAFTSQFGSYTGVFNSPFKSNLAFGKLSWQAAANQLLDFSGNYRKENEIRDFGGQTSYESATNLKNSVDGATLRHQWNSNTSLNQATLSLQKYYWHQDALDQNLVGKNYQGIIRIGGRSTIQQFTQRRIELRDDYNFGNFDWLGTHSLQVGGNIDSLNYNVNKEQFGNPEFQFRTDPANGLTLDQPFEVNYG